MGRKRSIFAAAAAILLLATPQHMRSEQRLQGAEIVRLDPALDALLSTTSPIQKVATGFVYTEGPMWREGRLWFSDEEGDRVEDVTPDGKVNVLVDYTRPPLAAPAGRKTGPNAMATAPDGSVVMMQQYARAAVRLVEHDGRVHPEPMFDSYDGHRLNSPNDVVFARDGSFYFTDPPYGLKGGDHDPAKQLPFNAVYHDVHGTLTPIIKDLTLPNGLGLSPDGKVLYVANSGPDMRVMRYDVQPDGSVTGARVFAAFTHDEGPGIPDGLKLDSQGNVWMTAPGGIRIIRPDGKIIGQIRLPEVPANLAWGEDGKTLYITAMTSIYRVRTKVLGELPAFHR
jgi:gluconolactonase